jgi:hypothetical protein
MDDNEVPKARLLQVFGSVSALLAEGNDDVRIELSSCYAVLRAERF